MFSGKATSYGDARDQAIYKQIVAEALSHGFSPAEAARRGRVKGDPGIGWMDNDLSDLTIPWVAVPHDIWMNEFGSKHLAHKAKLRVTIHGKSVVCVLGDEMPPSNITRAKNGSILDLAPGAQAAFNLTPPFVVDCTWQWL